MPKRRSERRSAPRPWSATHGYKRTVAHAPLPSGHRYETTTQVSSLPDEGMGSEPWWSSGSNGAFGVWPFDLEMAPRSRANSMGRFPRLSHGVPLGLGFWSGVCEGYAVSFFSSLCGPGFFLGFLELPDFWDFAIGGFWRGGRSGRWFFYGSRGWGRDVSGGDFGWYGWL